jgi:hypothetical protein
MFIMQGARRVKVAYLREAPLMIYSEMVVDYENLSGEAKYTAEGLARMIHTREEAEALKTELSAKRVGKHVKNWMIEIIPIRAPFKVDPDTGKPRSHKNKIPHFAFTYIKNEPQEAATSQDSESLNQTGQA